MDCVLSANANHMTAKSTPQKDTTRLIFSSQEFLAYIHDLFDKAGYRSIGKTLSPDVDLHYLR